MIKLSIFGPIDHLGTVPGVPQGHLKYRLWATKFESWQHEYQTSRFSMARYKIVKLSIFGPIDHRRDSSRGSLRTPSTDHEQPSLNHGNVGIKLQDFQRRDRLPRGQFQGFPRVPNPGYEQPSLNGGNMGIKRQDFLRQGRKWSNWAVFLRSTTWGQF